MSLLFFYDGVKFWRIQEISKNLYEEKSKEIKVDRQTLINKVKKIRDFKQTDLKSLQKFADMFIYRIYLNKVKKIAVLFNLSDGLNRTNCSDKYPLVELMKCETCTSLVLSKHSIELIVLA